MNTIQFTCSVLTKITLVKMALALSLIWVSGCSRLAVSDGSLHYRQAHLVPPVQLPKNQPTRAFVPMYDLPPLPKNTSKTQFTNRKGNRFELPLPPTIQTKNP